MRIPEISKEESDLLRRYLRVSPLVHMRLRCQALLMREQGLALEVIGHIVSCGTSTIARWIKEWGACRMASLFTGHKGNGNAGKLTQSQRQAIKEALEKPPSDHGLSKEFWDVPTLKSYVQAIFGVVYESDRSYHFLLKFSKLSFKYPDTFDLRRNEAEIGKRIAIIRTEIKPFLTDPTWEVFASDEVRIELESLTRRAWLKRGERTVLKINRKRESQSYIGMLNQKSSVCHVYEIPWQNQDEVLKALQLFLKEYPDKKICIVWDNASFHKGKLIRGALETGGLLERVHLIALPPYAPDKNPIEHVWNTAKSDIANVQHDTFQQTKDAFSGFIKNRTFAYKI